MILEGQTNMFLCFEASLSMEVGTQSEQRIDKSNGDWDNLGVT